MRNNILQEWDSTASKKMILPIIPDGCRDLIFKQTLTQKPHWFISPLAENTSNISTSSGDIFKGYRLKPGTRINQEKLLSSVLGKHFSRSEIYDRIDQYTRLSPTLDDALSCLASNASSVSQSAKELGVSQRSLQRLILKETGKTPIFWLQLARVRKTGRAIIQGTSLVEIAATLGFSDQAHMSRELRRWLAISPSQLTPETMQSEQLFSAGFASDI